MNRDMVCNSNQAQNPNGYQVCTLDYCKEEAFIRGNKLFSYASGHWCLMCHTNADGSLIDQGPATENSVYSLFECKGRYF